MNLTRVQENIYQYEFLEGSHNPILGINITVIIEGNKALIIDTGFEWHAKKVKEDLENKNIYVEKVILSHFHPDHISGSSIFKDSVFIGSKVYKNNLNMAMKWLPDNEFIEPNIYAEELSNFITADNKFRFINTPGHSKCSISTIINEKVIHIGDLLMDTVDGKTIVPYISYDGDIQEHINSLVKILYGDYQIILLAHGHYLSDKKEIEKKIKDRIYYLNKLQEFGNTRPFEDYLQFNHHNYVGENFHKNNIRQLSR